MFIRRITLKPEAQVVAVSSFLGKTFLFYLQNHDELFSASFLTRKCFLTCVSSRVIMTVDNMSERVKPIEQEKMPEPSSNGFHDATERPSSTENSSSQSTTVDENSEVSLVLVVSTNSLPPTQATDPDKKAKVIKNSYWFLIFRIYVSLRCSFLGYGSLMTCALFHLTLFVTRF
jgi:hypothetical protein